jgi:hypothetical protein
MREDTLGAQVLTREVMSTMASDLKGIKIKCNSHVAQHEHGEYLPQKEREEYDAMVHKALEDCKNIRRL